MSRDSKKKLAIVAGISECLVYAEAKYCAFEVHGEPKYYVCPRAEYCCNFGCCVSPGFQIYHLWYYWLLVIIMFLVCSGGGWWYRYWLQGRYRAAASAIPSRGTSNSRGHNNIPGRTCPAQQASITYNSARNTVLLHRMWKGAPHRGPGSSPAYTGPPVTAAASSAHFQNTSVVLNDVNCPYYQLYGPPPSYETVIAQTRGKISSPLSPERSRNTDLNLATASNTLQNQDTAASHCYNHSPYNNNHPSQNSSNIGAVNNAVSCYEQTTTNVDESIHHLDSLQQVSSSLSRYLPSLVNNEDGTTPVHTSGRQDSCLPLRYHGGPIPPLDYHEDREAIVPDTYRIYRGSENLERLPSYHGDRKLVENSRTRRERNEITSNSIIRNEEGRRSTEILANESHSSVPDLKIEVGDLYGRREKALQDNGEEERPSRIQGGSLKFSRTRTDRNTIHESFRRGQNFFDVGSTSWATERILRNSRSAVLDDEGSTSVDRDFRDVGTFSRSTRKEILAKEKARTSVTRYGVKHQTNPSDNVILEPLTAVNINETEGATGSPNNRKSSSNYWRRRCHDNKRDNDYGFREYDVDDDDEDEDEDDDDDEDDNEDDEDEDDDDEKRRRRAPSPGSRGINNDDELLVVQAPINNHESKHNKLDRSKSLD